VKVAIGVLSSNGWLCHDYVMSLVSMIGFTRTQVPLQLVFVRASSSLVANTRNQCVKAALETECDKLLMIDSDMTFPHDTLVRLLAHDRAIVGGVYMRRGGTGEIIGVPLESGDYTGLTEMRQIGTGCILISMDVFRDLPKPWFRCEADESIGENVGEDVTFCRMVRERGWRVWADIDLPLGHIDQRILECPK